MEINRTLSAQRVVYCLIMGCLLRVKSKEIISSKDSDEIVLTQIYLERGIDEARYVVMHVRRENAFTSILLVCGMILCIFFIRFIDKSANAYSKNITDTHKDEQSSAVIDKIGVIEKDPNLAEIYKSQAGLYYSRGRYDQAISGYTKALEINSRDAFTYYKRGNAYKAKCKYDQAISDYNKALEIRPQYAEAYYYRAIAYNAKNQHDEALSDFTKALEISPRLVEAYHNRGNLYVAKGLYDKAILDFDKAIEISPQYAMVYNYLGNAYKAKADADAIAIAEAQAKAEADKKAYAEALAGVEEKLKAESKIRAEIEDKLRAEIEARAQMEAKAVEVLETAGIEAATETESYLVTIKELEQKLQTEIELKSKA